MVADPACTLASLSVLAIRHGKVAYQQQFGQRFIGTADLLKRARPTPAPCSGSPRFPR
ncbi:hypothetical protein LP419_20405 [Massilia sp. H-1]|nr:hypothetical protein LP419_20405 [Massilia sp. H-1]